MQDFKHLNFHGYRTESEYIGIIIMATWFRSNRVRLLVSLIVITLLLVFQWSASNGRTARNVEDPEKQEVIHVNVTVLDRDGDVDDTHLDDNQHRVPFCSNEERLALLRSKCSNVSKSVSMLTKDEKVLLYQNIFVDRKHKLLACLPPKSGCTTWKSILANNSQPEIVPPTYEVMKLHYGRLADFGIQRLSALSDQEGRTVLATFTKFLVTRHPLERFRSAYIDKLASGSDKLLQRKIGGPVLKRFYGKEEAQRRLRENLGGWVGVTVDMFVTWLQETGLNNPHWIPVHDLCQPCAVKYDHVLKTESLDHDNEHMILTYLQPYTRGLGTKGNSVAGGQQLDTLSPRGRKLDVYANLTAVHVNFLDTMFGRDSELFGYGWHYDNTNGTSGGKGNIYSSCVQGSTNRHCC